MEKTLKTEAELVALLNANLRNVAVCDDVSVASIERLDAREGEPNWDAHCARASGGPPVPDCQRLFIGIKQSLRRQYDLFTDD